ncbi:hypothetical protein [Mycobacterium riyadhense]|uniref:hypothetical protein n=1 Tax=Mycobacterium riyadhense TaxID=486698 RepID=UPI00194DC8B7|nr:hypothetical protein [Mycobacterium riyadhense]
MTAGTAAAIDAAGTRAAACTTHAALTAGKPGQAHAETAAAIAASPADATIAANTRTAGDAA